MRLDEARAGSGKARQDRDAALTRQARANGLQTKLQLVPGLVFARQILWNDWRRLSRETCRLIGLLWGSLVPPQGQIGNDAVLVSIA